MKAAFAVLISGEVEWNGAGQINLVHIQETGVLHPAKNTPAQNDRLERSGEDVVRAVIATASATIKRKDERGKQELIAMAPTQMVDLTKIRFRCPVCEQGGFETTEAIKLHCRTVENGMTLTAHAKAYRDILDGKMDFNTLAYQED